jgi:two-component system phosphate regulon sensor histidine kinase PhoR
MPRPSLPPLRLLATAATAAAALLAGATALIPNDPLAAPLALAALVAGALAMGLNTRLNRRDLKALASYARRLAEGNGETPSPDTGTPEAQDVAAAITRLSVAMADRQRQVEAQLDADEAILEALHDPLILVESSRQVVRANTAACRLFGKSMLDLDLAACLRTPKVLEAVDGVLAGGASRSEEFSQAAPVEQIFEARVKPFHRLARRAGARPERMAILTLHDITTIKRSEQMRADFVANASHELRTPLSTLHGFIETLQGPARDDAEARDRFLAIMHDQAGRMSRLVRDLLSLSRIELDEHMPPAGEVDMVDNVRAVMEALELKASARGIALRLNVPDGPATVVGDEDQLTQVFQNLLVNAITYTREGTEVTVSVTLTGTGGRGGGTGAMLAIAVADHGDGIARTHLPRLTERFYRVDAARSRALGGTGLGLAIVKHIVNRHRGRLTIESEVGQGSTFTVFLPASPP